MLELAAIVSSDSWFRDSQTRASGKGKKAQTKKILSWFIRADVVRKLDRSEPEPEVIPSDSQAPEGAAETSGATPF